MKIFSGFFLSIMCLSTYAQKLSNVQQAAQQAPANVKIDGKPNELDGSYQAFNKATEIYYTLANNNEILYLTIHATRPRIIQKILEGGVEFNVTRNKSNNSSEDVAIVFPLLNLPTAWKTLQGAKIEVAGYPKEFIPGRPSLTDSILTADTTLSFVESNKLLVSNLKEIRYSGISEIKDTLAGITDKTKYYYQLPLRRHPFKWITIYNEDDIKGMVQFDKNNELTYELSIPMRYIKLNVVDGKIRYQIVIHGRGEDGRPGNTYTYEPPPNRGIKDQDLQDPTDLTGEYTLLKQP